MKRAASSLTILFVSTLTFGQVFTSPSSSGSASSSAVQVVYVVDGSTLTTYNVDPQTFQATQVGTLTLQQSTYPSAITSPDGRFLYYTAYQNTSQQGEKLYVYRTNVLGVPQTPPVQEHSINGIYGFAITPAETFLYAIRSSPAGPAYNNYMILRYVLDRGTGKISQPQTEATYTLGSGLGGSEFCSPSIFGFSASGNEMYDVVGCSYHGGNSATYYERSLDRQTGMLGPDQQVFGTNSSNGSYSYAQFVKDLIFNFVMPNDYQQGVNYLDIYPQLNASTPLIHCTATMLQACGYDSGVAHPSGQYVFMLNAQGTTEVDRVELSQKKIVGPTGSMPYAVQQFSPDGTIAYAAPYSTGALQIDIYGFNLSTGALTTGGTISAATNLDWWLAAERH